MPKPDPSWLPFKDYCSYRKLTPVIPYLSTLSTGSVVLAASVAAELVAAPESASKLVASQAAQLVATVSSATAELVAAEAAQLVSWGEYGIDQFMITVSQFSIR